MVARTRPIGLLAVVATVIAAVPVTTQMRELAITHVSIIDVVEGRILPNRTVTISGKTISSVTPNGAPRRGAQVVDGRGKFLIPGLWDMHAHTEASGESWLQLYVANGVTGIRDMGSALDLILKLREATASGRVLGPRIFAAGPMLDDAPGDWPFRMRVKTAEDGRAAVRLLKSRGVDLIKVHDHTPRDAFFAIAEEARRQNLPLAGHVPIGLTVEQVIDAGQGDIEHLSNGRLWRPCSGGADYRPEACRPFFETLARRGIWQTPTLVATSELATIGTSASMVSTDHMAYAGKSLRDMWAANQRVSNLPELARILRASADVGALVVRDMARAGVGILAGCDSMIAGFCVHDELAAMVRGGMTPLAALQTATLNPARYFGLQQTAGSVAPGRGADLVLLDASPLTDITNVGRIRAVVVAGRLLDRIELDKLLTHVKIAAQKPDFSGEWKLNVQASTLSPIVAPVVQSGVLRIEHHEPTFTAHQTIVMDGKPFESNFELVSDGREVATGGGGRRAVSSLRWDGDALVFASRIQSQDFEMTIAFRYELQDGGRRLRAAEQLRGGGRDQDNLWVFERP